MGTAVKTKHSLVAKPFIKWAGGKGQLLDTFEAYYPQKLKTGFTETYIEPFLGGGAVLFDVLQKYPVQQAFAFDINPALIHTYKTIRDNSPALISLLEELQAQYLCCDSHGKKELYYSIREKYNFKLQKPHRGRQIELAAWFIFLNRTCFNGLYRVNRAGFYNVPAGEYKHPRICDVENLKRVSGLLQRVELLVGDYRESFRYFHDKAFMYFDPPYRPLNPTSRFTSYSQLEFDDTQQIALGEFFAQCHKKGGSLMLSNSDPKNENPEDDFFDDLYRDFHIHRVKAKRNINSKGFRRGFIDEILVTNYRPNA